MKSYKEQEESNKREGKKQVKRQLSEVGTGVPTCEILCYKTYLSKKVSKGPSDQGSHGLGDQRLVIQSLVVGSPSGDSTSTDDGRVTEQGAGGGLVLLEGGGLDDSSLLGESGVRADTESAHSKGERQEKSGQELHLCLLKEIEFNLELVHVEMIQIKFQIKLDFF